MRHGRFYPNWRNRSQVWIAKSDLYQSVRRQQPQACYVAHTSTFKPRNQPWYSDSGASRHMTGSKNHLDSYDVVKESKATFGEGAHGNSKGKEIRSGNHCCMGEQANVCSRTEKDNPEVRHPNLGDMNAHSMSKLISQEQARGVPELEDVDQITSGICNQGKQIKVQHQKVQEVLIKKLSMVGFLIYLLGLQVKQTDDGIFVSQSKYVKALLERFRMSSSTSTCV